MYSTLMLVATIPTTVEWSPKVASIMIACNILAIVITKLVIGESSKETRLPQFSEMFGHLNIGAILGATSLGHIIGVGMILGIASTGML
ncbi:photosystem I reaction center subunit PsaK [Candidatus Atelocyanobacterium thalassae]|uniref:Photosystem I reaction center subunit PsaK n=2 Tax=Candidatus Atelocyanobacterium thalassae TaxID=713887 RepID=A0A086CFV0_9CHRO|nr:photosystem I reaction center subunit PsaK [Candidatus Atelocyanobacterium thalassa]KFF41064.1 MAG: photosystem I reaction center subunit PsaK [Candidatus Atelocyanobacterium thalassa isolate SIO64986]BDA40097.1 photosystem I reaction center subunit PsaK [cyanobacterium endosymbiont of Braarudosphaera bigelowii]